MGKLTVEIVTPERSLASTHADEAIVPGARGLFGILPGHAPLLSLMGPGELTVKDAGNVQRYFVAGGFVQIAGDKVRVLADAAELVAEIDVAAARRELESAESRLKALPVGDSRTDAERRLVERARTRVEIASRPQPR